MIPISLSFSGKQGVGTRVNRFETEDLGEVVHDLDFEQKAKKKIKGPDRSEMIPMNMDKTEERIHVPVEIWLGRLERSPKKQRRITLPNVR